MNKDIFSGNWDIAKGKIKEKWSELTEEDLEKIKADGQQLYGILQKKLGYAQDKAKEEVDNFLEKFKKSNSPLNEELNNFKQILAEFAEMLKKQFSQVPEKISPLAQKGQGKMEETIQSHPLASVGWAALVGFVLGSLFLNRK